MVVTALRTAIGKARRGSFKDTTPDDLLKAVLEETVKRSGVNYADIGDVVVGNVQMGGSYANATRSAQFALAFQKLFLFAPLTGSAHQVFRLSRASRVTLKLATSTVALERVSKACRMEVNRVRAVPLP